jgi:hypothetical protein
MSKGRPGPEASLNISWSGGRSPVGGLTGVCYDSEPEVLHDRVINSGPYPISNAEATDVEGIKREFRISLEGMNAGLERTGYR